MSLAAPNAQVKPNCSVAGNMASSFCHADGVVMQFGLNALLGVSRETVDVNKLNLSHLLE